MSTHVQTARPALSVASALSAPFVVGALAFSVFAVWAAKDGGYAATTWYPGTLFLIGLLAVVAVAMPRDVVKMPRAAAVAAGLIAAYAVWSGASIAWSSARGVAWDGANRTLLYAAVYALFVSLRLRRVEAAVLLIGYGTVVAAIGAADVARAAFGGDPARFFLDGRLAAPMGYPNAACALFVMAAWPVLYAAGRREVAPLVRGALLAVACLLAQLAVLTQSRASMVAVPAAAVVYLAIVPFRLRALVPVGVVAAVVLLNWHRLTAPYGPLTHATDATPSLRHAAWGIAVAFGVVFVAWSAFAFLDRRAAVGDRVLRRLRALLAVGVAVAVVATLAAVVAASPLHRIESAWRDFRSGYPVAATSSSHFSSGLGNNRYDFWRVSADAFARHPVAGIGADNFAEQYVAARRSHEEPLYPHSLELRILVQTGIVGALLFGGFLVAGGIAARRTFASRDVGAGVVRAGVAAAAYWLIHGSVDWFWEFPALTAPAVAALALAVAGRRPDEAGGMLGRRAVAVALPAAAIAAAASCAFPWIADRLEQRASATWRADPATAFRDLSRARELNPLSPDPDLLAGAIASRQGNLGHMRRAFSDAVRRDPSQWYAHLELALAAVGAGRRDAALRELREARRLNPSEEVVRDVERRVRAHLPVSRAAIDRSFVDRYRRRAGLGRGI